MFFRTFWSLCLMISGAVCCRPWGCGGAGAHLEKPGFRMEGVSNFGLRRFSRAARKDRKRDEKQHRKQHQKASQSERKSNRKKQSKMIIFGAKMAPKIDPGGFFLASGGALARQEAARRAKSKTNETKGGPRGATRPPPHATPATSTP
jgi:hypothetical protein